jgi:hypothetical protein
MPSPKAMRVELQKAEIRILVQSLANCLDTCETKAEKPDAPCEDCDAARGLQRKLKKLLKS